MSEILCPVCKGKSKNANRNPKQYNDYQMYSCNDCNCLFSVPFIAPSGEFYANAEDVGSEERHTTLTTWYKDHPTQHSRLLANGQTKNYWTLDAQMEHLQHLQLQGALM